MRAAQIYLAVALVSSAAPALAAPVPRVEARGVELSERAALSGLLKPFLKSAGSSVALGGVLAGISSIFGGGDKKAAKRAEDITQEDLDDLIASLEASGELTQDDLDEAENALAEMFPEDGTVKREDLVARAGAGKLLLPFLKSAGSSAALGGILAGISSIFGGDKKAAKRAEDLTIEDMDDLIASLEASGEFTQDDLDEAENALAELFPEDGTVKREDLVARAGAGSALSGLLKPFLKSAGSSVALGGVLAGISSIFGGGDKKAAKRAEDLDAIFAEIENSTELTQEQLDEIEAELEKSIGSGAVEARSLDARALRLGGLTKGLVGIIGSIAGSLGIDAVLGGGKRATSAPTAEEMIAAIQDSDVFSQEQLDEIEAELEKSFGSDSVEARSLDARALRLGGLTKGLVGIIGSIAGSIGIDAVLGGGKRSFEGLESLD